MSNNLERIKAKAMQELVADDDAALGQLWSRVYAAFDQWKQERGNRKPKANRGMLSDLIGAKSIPFKKAAPWQCADFATPSPVALAVKLWRERYAPLEAITAEVGTRKVLALLVVGFGDDASESDLLAAHGVLRDYEMAEGGARAALQANRKAIIAQQTRSRGGKIRGEQLTTKKDDRKQLIKDEEASLPKDTKPHLVNKRIATKLRLPTDYVRRARSELKKPQVS